MALIESYSQPAALMDSRTLFELIEEIRGLSSIEEIHGFCSRLSVDIGFANFLFAARIPTSFIEPQSVIISGFPTEWWEHYKEHGFIPQDPVVSYTIGHNLPKDWHTIGLECGDHRGIIVMNQAREFGLRSGLVCPIHGAGGSLALLSLSSPQEHSQTYPQARHYMAYAHLLASHLQEALLRTVEIREITEQTRKLTNREAECLLWCAEGKTAWEIAQILNISERTAIYHLQNACQKLDVTSRQQAVARAISLGLISPQFS